MAAEDILRLAITVSVTQIICDLLANKFVYEKDPYRRAVSAFERAQTKYDKLVKETDTKLSGGNAKQQDKVKKRLEQAKNDLGEAKSEVAKRHSGPGMLSSIVFVILFRVLGIEHGGKVIGIIPFEPFSLLSRVTMRGLDFGGELGLAMFKDSKALFSVQQACSFTVIYLLCNMGLKFYVHKIVAEAPPHGADGGLMTVMESPTISRAMKQLGIDPDELKQD